MDQHIKEFYHRSSGDEPHRNFHSIIALHEAPDIDWKTIGGNVPALPRGWFELSHLSAKDRLEFTHDFWQTKLPFRNKFTQFIDRFFASLDDIGIFITQKKFDDPFEVDLVYSLKDNQGFYRGRPPISEMNLDTLLKFFSGFILPVDYLAFLQIHDGFNKTTDCTGIIPSKDMPNTYLNFIRMLQQSELPIVSSQGNTVDPKNLIPFYESFGMPFYQCFWAEWYPEQEMGNVYYSTDTKTISDAFSREPSSSKMAFPTFVDWLKFYLESYV